jgi:phosphohistidine phosphatase
MLLYLVRHAYAGQHGDPNYPDDSLRPLTTKGRKRFRRLVKKLARRGFAPQVVATSPLVRCRQTAEVIVERVKLAGPPVELDALKPGSELESLVSWSQQQQAEQIAWVGHSPDVEHLAAALLHSREGAVMFAKGAIAAIDFPDGLSIGHGELQWLATPKLFGR